MSTKSAVLRAEPHDTVGSVILRDAGPIVERWAARAQEEQPSAKRVHHDVLLDHLPIFLWELGRLLAEAHGKDPRQHYRAANVHGDQRWQAGWSVEEVVRDYQLLRIVITEYLDATIERPLRTRELLALGVFIDDAIAASIAAYTACQAAASGQAVPQSAAKERTGIDLLGVLGVLGHELRNPLAPLGNSIQLLGVCAADPAAVERVRGIMDRQVQVMSRLVDDMLDLPRLIHAKVQLKPGQVDLSALARNVVDDRREAFATAGLTIGLELPTSPVITSGDAGRLSQVLGNLLQNAIKFTDRGGSINIRLVTDDARRVVVLSVKDTGIGMDQAVLPVVFEPFIQADRSIDRSRGGLGLGLALVKGLVELHGGTVRAESSGLGRGSEFVVELPLIDLTAATSAPAARAVPPTSAAAARRILIVEDNRDSAESLKMYLELLGHQVTVAHTGPAALKVVAQFTPDVVVCDIGLPGMSGHAVCAELKRLPGLVETLFVAISGHAADSPVADGASESFDLYMVKPVEPDRLAEAIVAGRRPRLP